MFHRRFRRKDVYWYLTDGAEHDESCHVSVHKKHRQNKHQRKQQQQHLAKPSVAKTIDAIMEGNSRSKKQTMTLRKAMKIQTHYTSWPGSIWDPNYQDADAEIVFECNVGVHDDHDSCHDSSSKKSDETCDTDEETMPSSCLSSSSSPGSQNTWELDDLDLSAILEDDDSVVWNQRESVVGEEKMDDCFDFLSDLPTFLSPFHSKIVTTSKTSTTKLPDQHDSNYFDLCNITQERPPWSPHKIPQQCCKSSQEDLKSTTKAASQNQHLGMSPQGYNTERFGNAVSREHTRQELSQSRSSSSSSLDASNYFLVEDQQQQSSLDFSDESNYQENSLQLFPQQWSKSVRFADEVGKPIESVHFVECLNGANLFTQRLLILLLLPKQKKYEFIHINFSNTKGSRLSVSSLLRQLPLLATDPKIASQKYCRLCRADNGNEMINALSIQDYNLGNDEILVGILKGYDGKQMHRMAQSILDNNEAIMKAVKRSDRTVKRITNEHRACSETKHMEPVTTVAKEDAVTLMKSKQAQFSTISEFHSPTRSAICVDTKKAHTWDSDLRNSEVAVDRQQSTFLKNSEINESVIEQDQAVQTQAQRKSSLHRKKAPSTSSTRHSKGAKATKEGNRLPFSYNLFNREGQHTLENVSQNEVKSRRKGSRQKRNKQGRNHRAGRHSDPGVLKWAGNLAKNHWVKLRKKHSSSRGQHFEPLFDQ